MAAPRVVPNGMITAAHPCRTAQARRGTPPYTRPVEIALAVLPAIPLVVAVAATAVVATRVRRGEVAIAGPAAVAGVTALGWTVATIVFAWPRLPPWGMLEPAVCCVLVAAIACYARPGWPAIGSAVVVAVAAASAVLRADAAVAVGPGLGIWSLAPITAGLLGLLARRRRERRAEAAESLRRLHRLELAHDLHDYVAHDVSDMLASVQAARFLAPPGTDTEQMLARAEAAGQHAMSALDRIVDVLQDPTRARPDRPPDLADLPVLVERFNAAGAEQVRLRVEGDPDAVPREPGALAHRIVAESLTNIRRHAPGTPRVDVLLVVAADHVQLSVRDAGPASRTASTRRTGSGIAGLRAQVEAVGGSLRAGPAGDGWSVAATLPLTSVSA